MKFLLCKVRQRRPSMVNECEAGGDASFMLTEFIIGLGRGAKVKNRVRARLPAHGPRRKPPLRSISRVATMIIPFAI